MPEKKSERRTRPILTERARAVLVAAVAAVDQLIVFEETDVKSLLREFQPDVYACGPDGIGLQSLTGELAALRSTRALIVTAESSHSTTALIAGVRRGTNG